ncbi:MAG TPA: YidC/Oxa1 family membrane protein insertase [Candidatus Paceibacterota bacterium]
MFNTLIYNPLYNGLVILLDYIPGGDLGLATIALTCIVKLILFPLSKQATKTQIIMKALEPELAELKKKYGSNREEFARKTLDFYKKHKLNPFASFFLLLIQIPIILGLAFIFFRGGFPEINSSILYSFVAVPESINTQFLGLIDITKTSIVLGVLAGIAQFVQIRLSVPAYKPKEKDKKAQNERDFAEELARNMNVQMRYVMPVFMFIICLTVSGAVALYWITGSLFTIGQELYFRKTLKKDL